MSRRSGNLWWTPHALVCGAIVGLMTATLVRVDVRVGATLAVAAAVGAHLGARQGRAGWSLALVIAASCAGGWLWGTARVQATAVRPVARTATVTATLTVESMPAVTGGRQRVRARVVGTQPAMPGVDGVRVIVDLPGDAPGMRPGRIVRASGRLGPAGRDTDPGWWRRYLARQQISGMLRAERLSIVGRRGGVAGIRDRLRERLVDAAGRGLDGDRAVLVRGMALGGGGELSEATAERMRRAGLWHLLAVSGQNVAFVAIGVSWLTGLLGLRRTAGLVAALVTVVVYCLMCDGGASVVRAGVVGSLVIVGEVLARERDRVYLTLVGLLVLLAWQPRSIADPGLQLSFAAVAGLVFVAPKLVIWLQGFVPRRVAEPIAASIAASLATAPATIANFGGVSLVGVVANVLVAVLVGPVVIAALLGAVVGAVGGALGIAPTIAAGWGAAAIAHVARIAAAAPGAAVSLPAAGAVAAAVVAAAIPAAAWLAWARAARPPAGRPMRIIVVATSVLVLAGGSAALAGRERAEPWPAVATLSVLDVGQGDAILLRGPAGEAVLVDTGPPGSPPAVIGELRRRGVQRLDMVLVTHDQSDHAGALGDVMRGVRVGQVGAPRAGGVATTIAARIGRPVSALAAGDRLVVGAWTLDVLWPERDARPKDPNDGALVVRAAAGAFTALLTADAEGAALRRAAGGPVDVLKVAHHGSADVDLPAVLARIRPAVALISVGARNPFGHPAPTTLAALAAAGVPVWRTDTAGGLDVSASAAGIGVRGRR